MHFCHHSGRINICLQQFVNDNGQIPGLPQWLHTAGLTSDSLQIQDRWQSRAPVTDCRVDGGEVPSCSSESSPCKMSSVRSCTVILHDDLSLQSTFVTQSTMKLLEFLKVMCSIDGFLSWPNLTNKHPQHYKRQFTWSDRLRALFWLHFLGQCCVTPFHTFVTLFLN